MSMDRKNTVNADRMRNPSPAQVVMDRKARRYKRRAATKRHKRHMRRIAGYYENARWFRAYGRPYVKRGHVCIPDVCDMKDVKDRTHRMMRNMPVPDGEEEWESTPSTNGNYARKQYNKTHWWWDW